MRRVLSLLVVTLGLLLAGCGDESPGETTTTSAGTDTVRIYLLRDGKVWPVSRDVAKTGVSQLDEELRRGPTDDERKAGFTSEVTDDVTHDAHPSRAALAQMVYTFTQSDPTQPFEINGKTYTRADFEEQTPLILVESPLPHAAVTSPLRVTGTANTFEATFQYELLGADGKVVDTHFVTATSGTETRGTFDFTTKPFDDVTALRVFELSAENGSRVHEVEIPLTGS